MIEQQITVIMYHYVRDLQKSKYPKIKGLDTKEFKFQIEYLKKHYNFISVEQLLDSIDLRLKLPPNAVLLTFDDAYADHYDNVFPILLKNNIKGAFFPPIKAIIEHEVLDVNKIHFILAKCQDSSKLIQLIFNELDSYRVQHNLYSNDFYYKKLAHANRFDSSETIFIKRILQNELIYELRKKIVDKLFNIIVGIDEIEFSKELYMSTNQIMEMYSNGMHFGSHGYDHFWLNTLDYKEQEVEIIKSIDFIKSIGGDLDYLSICYPYGAYNQDTIEILNKYNFKAGFTTIVDLATINKESRFVLPRKDTNDFPKS